METLNIQIPAPDFDFESIAKKRAKDIIDLYIYLNNFSNPYLGTSDKIKDDVRADFYDLKEQYLQIVFLNEILLRIVQIKSEHEDIAKKYLVEGQKIKTSINLKHEGTLDSLNEMQFFIYRLIDDTGFNLDKNAFNNDEVSDLNSKINSIIEKLNEVQLGQEIIFDDITVLKKDFESLKSDYPLGKKRWYQRAAGVVVSYAGTKGADEVYEQLKPLFREFFSKTVTHFIEKL